MVARSVDFAARATGGRPIGVDGAAVWSGASLDSRTVTEGQVFFALEGGIQDGHAWAASALEGGAALAVVHRAPEGSTTGRWLWVDDTYRALHDLTRAVRREVPSQLIALTGSMGKTTTKELTATMLAQHFRVGRSPGNLNNLYGFPLALLGLEEPCDWMVAEMGMSTPGELAGVSRLGRPDVAVLLNVRAVHLQNFADLRGIADAKSEILAGLRDDGTFVAHADDPEVLRIARGWEREHPDGRLVLFGRGADADVRLGEVTPREGGAVGSRFDITAAGEAATFELPVHGLFHAENALAAAAAAWTVGVPLVDCATAVRDFRPARMRGEIHRLGDGTVLVDDSYNANPAAVAGALESLHVLAGGRRVAVLGDMLELGPDEARYHRETGRRAAEAGVEVLVGVGPLSRAAVEAAAEWGVEAVAVEDAATAARVLLERRRAGDVILVKGSRGIGLERVVRDVLAARESAVSVEGGR